MVPPVAKTVSRAGEILSGVGRRGEDVVFHVVWTGETFSALRPLIGTQLDHDRARYRFLANACPPSEVAAMEAFATDRADRVVEVMVVATDRMIRHGQALDIALAERDDGDLFAFIDPDILARGPFLDLFVGVLERADAVTSGREVWSETNVRPASQLGISGEHFFDRDGFVFGSPHLALYRRDALTAVTARWDVGFGVTGNDVSEQVRARLAELGRLFWVYDTGKVVNILLQGDGHTLEHVEHPDLLHVGGVAHLLAPPSTAPAARGRKPSWGEGSDWGDRPDMVARATVARFAADTITALRTGRPVPEVPSDLAPVVRERVVELRDALRSTVSGDAGDTTGRRRG